ncbi:MAG: L-seryl-tRNA(Sec) selenium transferase, partial [Thermodesulfovibrionales bacterium]|nr:L-seryl-tRNA(Sec) selenium transferase [Thermodesulfovibrionales bacterium]
KLPSVDEILKSKRGLVWQSNYHREYVVKVIREVLEEVRSQILEGDSIEIDDAIIYERVDRRLQKLSSFNLIPVINATGVVIHTNLGRSILSKGIMEHVKEIACNYSNLEYDLERGVRGKRYSHIQNSLSLITGAESSLIVNNNAAAVFICLNTLARGKEVIVSRGELVEIGGSFRIPDIMSCSGAILKEVGTTNKTHLYDYERAINENTALLLKVHQSNFKISGFTELPSVEDVVQIGNKYNIPVMFDLGSGCLIDLKPYGIHIEPMVKDILKAGVAVVTFSGDKLLGGPQGGIIAGKADLIERISKNPFMRVIRVDKITLSAFEVILKLYLHERKAKEEIPTLRMILEDKKTIRKRAQRLMAKLKGFSIKEAEFKIVDDYSEAGGGSLPGLYFETCVVSIKPYKVSVNSLEERLRRSIPPVIARIKADRLILDMRTVQNREIDILAKNLMESLKM